jgi:hypothetical protein
LACKTLTPQSILNGALALLFRPPALMSKIGDCYDILGTTVESYRNKMKIHDGNFILKKKTVPLPANQITASFQEQSWGTPVFCDVDPDSVPAGITLPKREIDIVNLHDLDQYRAGLPNVMGQDINLLPSQAWIVAAAVAWNREGDDIKLYFEFGGLRPQQEVTYRFFYEPGGVAEVLENTKADILPEFVGLLQHDFALALLPDSGLEEPRYTRRLKYLEQYVTRNWPIMEEFLQQGDHVEQSGRFEGFNRNRYGMRLNR